MHRRIGTVNKKHPVISYGLIGPDEPDKRDVEKEIPAGSLNLEKNKTFSLRNFYPTKIRSQGRTNRCGGFTGAAGLDVLSGKIAAIAPMIAKPQKFSANEVYWAARDNRSVDSGVYMRNLMKGLHERGAVLEKYWKDSANLFRKPRAAFNAPKFRIPSYERIFVNDAFTSVENRVENCLKVLEIEHLPLFIGAKMYAEVTEKAVISGFFDAPRSRDILEGGHAMLIIGYQTISGVPFFILQNSWGTWTGDNGLYYASAEMWIEKGIFTDVWTVNAKFL